MTQIMSGRNEKYNHLTLGLLLLSEANNWVGARLEWTIISMYQASAPITCLCGRTNISNVCVLINHKNKKNALVGACCAKKFLDLPADKIFKSFQKIQANPSLSLCNEASRFALNKEWISQWEYDFSVNNNEKRTLSEKQLLARKTMNAKVLRQLKAERDTIEKRI